MLRSKLLPLAEASALDKASMRTLTKIFVLLTMPMSAKASTALTTYNDPEAQRLRKKDGLEKMSKGKLKLRMAAIQQAKLLVDCRAAFAERPRVLGSLLRLFDGLHKSKERRSDVEAIDVELALTLIRNLVHPIPSCGDDYEDAKASAGLDALTAGLGDELVLDVLCELCSGIHQRENQPWNLLLAEVLGPLVLQHKPGDVAAVEFVDAKKRRSALKKREAEENLCTAILYREDDEAAEQDRRKRAYDDRLKRPLNGGALSRTLAKEKRARTLESSSRHGRFGTVLKVVATGGGPDKFVAGTTALRSRAALRGEADGDAAAALRTAAPTRARPVFVPPHKVAKARRGAGGGGKKKKKKAEGRDSDTEDEDDAAPHKDELSDEEHDKVDEDEDWVVPRAPRVDEVLRLATATRRGPGAEASVRAASALVLKLSKHGFAKLLDSVKNELRVDGARLNARDRHLFFALAEFLLCWRRERAGLLAKRLQQHAADAKAASRRSEASGDAGDADGKAAYGEGAFFPRPLLRLCDVFTVKATLENVESAVKEKRLLELERSAGLYKELLRSLEALKHGDRTSRRDRAVVGDALADAAAEATDVKLASAMLEKIFLAADTVDPLYSMLQAWGPGKHTKRYACDLAEIVHVSCKVLDRDDAANATDAGLKRFDLAQYLYKLLKQPNTMDLYAALLEGYASNAPHVNHFVYAFLRRVAMLPIRDVRAGPGSKSFQLPPTSAEIKTCEPLLYRVRYFKAFARLLDDRKVGRVDGTVDLLCDLAKSTLRHFDAHAQRHPMLYVEALFGAGGHRPEVFCDKLTYDYDGAAPARDDDDAMPVKKLYEDGDFDDDAREYEDDEDDVDFEALAAADEAAKTRLAAKPKEPKAKRWSRAEDATLCLVLAKTYEREEDADLAALAKLPVLQPHHADEKKLQTRCHKLVDDALAKFPQPDDLDETSSWVAALRAFADDLKSKPAPKPRAKKPKKAAAEAPVEDDDDEELVKSDDDDDDDDDAGRAPAAPPSPRRTRGDSAAAAAAAAPPPPPPRDDMSEDDADDDDKWNERRKFHKPAAEIPELDDLDASQGASRLKKRAAADSDSDDDLELEVEDAPAPAPAPDLESDSDDEPAPPPTHAKRRRVAVFDDEDDE